MKTKLLILATFLLPLSLIAQDCNLDKDQIDPYTKISVKEGTQFVGKGWMRWTLTLNKKGDQYGWAMHLWYEKYNDYVMKKGETIFCRLEDGKVVNLVLGSDISPLLSKLNGTSTTTFDVSGELDEATMKSFSVSPVAGIRTMVAGNVIEQDIPSKQGKKVQEIAACLLK